MYKYVIIFFEPKNYKIIQKETSNKLVHSNELVLGQDPPTCPCVWIVPELGFPACTGTVNTSNKLVTAK
ncbi:hypothetical protein ABE82_05465 [Paenibacillus peoriae]|nr:hypothetical protein ABE82_05465 [Paenibacillus peoriae]ODB65743.1 hypothetical protein A7309_08625 [Paenibacillus polymyxa]OMF82930.1 hypothetical protein BK145_05740 [Paenibacillus peoriae]